MGSLKNTLPIMLLKNLFLLPNQEVKLELNNELSKKIIQLSTNEFRSELIVLTPKDQIEEYPDLEDLPKIAVVAKIKSNIELPNGNYRITIRGLFRAHLEHFKNDKKEENILECFYKKLEIPAYDPTEALAVRRKLCALLKRYVNNADEVSNSILNIVKNIEDLNKLTDVITSFLPLDLLRKLEYVEEINPVVRGTNLLSDLQLELEVIKLDHKLDQKMHQELEKNQKEFILKQKMHEIQKELGEDNEKEKEILEYHEKLKNVSIKNPKTILKIQNEIKKLEYTSDANPEISNIRNYLDLVFDLPWEVSSSDEENLNIIEKRLEKSHYGMKDAKAKVVEYIAAKKRNPNVDSPILCLVGPAGVGKTTFAKSVADALQKEFYKISVGGLNDSAVLNGHRRTYLGANPGTIIEALRRTKTNNPLILIDEVDKMVKDYKGDPASVLLDILDKEQNKEFIDHYLEEPFDLSNIFFMLTANRIYDIPYELYDRLEIVELSSYTILEKIEIAKKYLLPKIFKEHAINSKDIKISDSILKEIISGYTSEAGVRELERILTTIIRKLIVLEKISDVKIDSSLVTDLLGIRKYTSIALNEQDAIGSINCLAIRASSGFIMPMESVLYEGTGAIKITGMLEKVMEESVQIALSYIIANKEKYKINDYYFKTKNIHVHFLDGASKKDGPSAGVAITTSFISLATNQVVPKSIAMTGEITLNGFVKKVGGIKEKLIGAYHNGIKKVFIPKENHNDLTLVPEEVTKKIQIIEVTHYEEIYQDLFLKED